MDEDKSMTEEFHGVTNDINDPNFIPGTFNIYSSAGDETRAVKTLQGVILVPQPTESVNDPLNYKPWRKVLNLVILCYITALTAATSNDFGATQDGLNEAFGISYDLMNTSAGILFIAIGTTTFILAPISSLYGRKMNYFICILLGLLGSIWMAKIRNGGDALWNQMFVGASESCAEAAVQQSLTDLYFQHQLGHVLTYYILATSIGTYLGPLIAGYIEANTDYTWVGWTAVIVSGFTLIVIVLFMDNTQFDRRKYAKPERTVEGINATKSQSNVENKKDTESENNVRVTLTYHGSLVSDNGASESPNSWWENKKMIKKASHVIGTGFKQYFKILFMSLRVFFFPGVIYSGFVWGLQSALLTFYLTVEDNDYYDPPYNYSNAGVAIMNVPCLIGALLGCIYAGVISDWFNLWLARRNNGIQEAENRLYFLFLSGIIGPVGLVLFAVGTDKAWPWFPTYLGLVFIGFAFGASGDVALAYLMDAYPDMVIEMMCGVAVINNYIGMIFTFACSPWLDAMGNTHTFVILAVLECVVAFFSIFFLRYGKLIRKKTTRMYLNYCKMRDNL